MPVDKPNGGLNGTSLVAGYWFSFLWHEPAGCNKGPLKSVILHSGSLRVSFLFRGCYLPRGSTRVEYCYRNRKTFSASISVVKDRTLSRARRRWRAHAYTCSRRYSNTFVCIYCVSYTKYSEISLALSRDTAMIIVSIKFEDVISYIEMLYHNNVFVLTIRILWWTVTRNYVRN